VADGALQIALANPGPGTRVHLVATRYLAPFDPVDRLAVVGPVNPASVALPGATSGYLEGREIGDEYRYVLERRFATRFPGNMLARPSLLLNPWALDSTVSDGEAASFESDQWNEAVGLGGGAGGKHGGRGGSRSGLHPGVFPNLAFLPQPSRVLANLRPDGNGVVRVPLAEFGDGHLVHVIAIDDTDTVRVTKTLPEKPLEPAGRRLRGGLDPALHLAEQRRIDIVPSGGAATIDDVRHAEIQVYDSLASVHRLFRTLTGDVDLAEFEFVLRWPELSDDEKARAYAGHACHELHLFIFQKDRAFFDATVRPYLANRLHRTFLDDWLLEEDLSGYLDPWAFARLNVVERILLGRRLPAQAAAVARQLREQVELLPPSSTAAERLFRRSLHGDALRDATAADQGLGRLKELQKKADSRGPADGVAPRPSAEAAAAPPVPDPSRSEPEPSQAPVPAALELARGRRANAQALYRGPEATRRHVEQGYWHRRIDEHEADLVGPGLFWQDFAAASPDAPFLSVHVAEAAGSFTEMLLALAVLDLPFRSVEHRTGTEGSRLSIRAESPLLLLRQEIAPIEPAPAGSSPVLVSQGVFRLDEPYRFDGNQRRDAYLTRELLVDVPYGCRVVVTNPSSSPRELDLLMQIPEGAIPVDGGFETIGMPVRLEPYATRSIEFAFYFPQRGEARQYPVQVAEGGRLAAAARPVVWQVRTEPTQVDTTSWEHVSQSAEPAAVLRFLDTANLLRIDLGRIAWRMRDRAVFDAVLARLRARLAYSDVLYSYGIFHGDPQTTREYLRHADGFLARCGPALTSPLVTIDPIERRSYQHAEFDPLFNPRAHRFGGTRRILDDGLAAQYRALLEVLCHQREIDSESWFSLTYYLLLQDRIEEALASFARVDASALPARLQYDYARAYLDLFTPDRAVARQIAEQYRNHPIERWRGRFREVIAQLDEADGRTVAVADTEDGTRRLSDLAAREPSLELSIEGSRIELRYRNIRQCRVSYRLMDVELLFSTHPFVAQGSGAFAWVQPNRVDEVMLPQDAERLEFDLPVELRGANLLIEVSAGGITRCQPRYASALAVRWIESYGQLQVSRSADGGWLPGVYVKVFARTGDGGVRFHKDGYTDLRGRFDYASLSGSGSSDVQRFAVLVLSEDLGATIREVAPPAR
jgi:hypothetical protein